MLGLLLLAAPQQPIKLACPSLSYVNVTPASGELFLDYFAKQIELHGVRVTTSRELGALMGLERQRQLLGCTSDSSACMAELAGALGVDGVITGTLARMDSDYVINLKIVDNAAQPLAVFSERLSGDRALLDWLKETARTLPEQLARSLHRQAPGERAPLAALEPSAPVGVATTSSGGLREKAWIPAVAGGVLAAGGVGLYLAALDTRNKIAAGDPGIADATMAHAGAVQGHTLEVAGYALMGAGAVGLGVSGAMALLGAPANAPGVSVAPLSGGAALAVGGSF